MKTAPIGIGADPAALTALPTGTARGLTLDNSGRLVVLAVGGGGGTYVVVGNKTPSDAFANPTDAVGTWSLNGLWTGAVWRRWTSVAPGDAVANPAGAAEVQAYNAGWNTASWERLQSGQVGVADINNPTAGGLRTAALLHGQIAGITWRGIATTVAAGFNTLTVAPFGINTPSDAFANPTTATLTLAVNEAWDGTNWRRQQVDGAGNTKVVGVDPNLTNVGASPSVYFVSGAVQTANVKASAGRVLAIDYLDPDLDSLFAFVDKASAAVNGDTVKFGFAQDVSDTEPLSKVRGRGREFFGPSGIAFATGITWAWSTTFSTVTLTTPAAGFVATIIYV